MCSITNSVRFRIPPARLQDIHKVGPPTGIPPTDARPCDQTDSNIQHPMGKVQTQETSVGAKSSQDIFDEVMFRIFRDVPHCLNQRDDILLRSVENSSSMSERPWHHIQQREMPIRKREDQVLWTYFYQRWIETIPGQGQSNQRVWST